MKWTAEHMQLRVFPKAGVQELGYLGQISQFDHSERITSVLVITGINLNLCSDGLVVYGMIPS